MAMADSTRDAQQKRPEGIADRTPTARQRGRQPLLTPQRHAKAVELIRAGAFDVDAAQAIGVSPRTFHRWVARGEADPGDLRYGSFALDVAQAGAEARAEAEMRVYRERPEVWLTKGPGRSRPGRPGWTDLPIEVEERLTNAQAEQIATVLARTVRDLDLNPEQLVHARQSLRRHLADVGAPATEV